MHDILRFGDAGDALTHFVLVPGNPGIPRYYAAFASTLSAQHDATVAVLGLLGHTEAPPHPKTDTTAPFHLDDQCDHVASFLRDEVQDIDGSGTSLVLVGHSIGAYIAFAAAERASADDALVARFVTTQTTAIGLMPFLETNELPPLRARVGGIKWLGNALVIRAIALAAHLVGMLPRRLVSTILRSSTAEFDEEARYLTETAIPRWNTILNVLTLFRAEALALDRPYDYTALRKRFGGRVGLLTAAGDTDYWAPSSVLASASVAGIATCACMGVPHAFSVAEATRDAVAEAVDGLLLEVVDRRR